MWLARGARTLSTADDPHLAVALAPLTRRNRAGDLYAREPDVERQIAGALVLPREELRKRVAITDRGSSNYLKEECLVYLLRHYQRGGNEGNVSDLAAALVRRSTRIIRKRLRALGPEALEEGYSEVVTRLFRKVLDVSSDKSDFFQVRFWFAMERICIQVFGELLAQHERGRNEIPFSQIPGYDDEEDAASETKSPRLTEEDKRSVSAPSDEKAIIAMDLRREVQTVVLTQLDEPFRSAYMLRHCYGWPIEHQDPAMRTISRHFGKTPRTIRNWLTKAEKTLARARGGKK
jgi:DNA-directed RNA polymerase specialized sigma24 family protein